MLVALNIIGLILSLLLGGCGKTTPTAVDTMQAQSQDAGSTLTFNSGDYAAICNALHTWNPNVNNILFHDGSVAYYFGKTKITQNAQPLTAFSNYVGVGGSPTCWYYIQGGQLVNVQ